MIPKKILFGLEKFYRIVNEQEILWILSGSVSLAIQGVNVKVNNDIDILTDKKGSEKINKLLSGYCIRKSTYSTTDKYRSYFGIYQIDDIKIEVMGEFQYKMKNGLWSKSKHLDKTIIKEFGGMKLPIIALEQELLEYENMGRNDKVNKIKDSIFP